MTIRLNPMLGAAAASSLLAMSCISSLPPTPTPDVPATVQAAVATAIADERARQVSTPILTSAPLAPALAPTKAPAAAARPVATSQPEPPSTAVTIVVDGVSNFSGGATLWRGRVSNTAVGWDARDIEVLMELRDSSGKVFLEDKAESRADFLRPGDTLSWTYLLSEELGGGKTETVHPRCRWWWWPTGIATPSAAP